MAEIKENRRELLAEGSLIKVYNSKTFVNIAAAYNIGKIRFSIVDIGKAGQNATDVYLDVEKVRQFLHDVDTGIALKKIAEDKGDYPTAYQWVTGENGFKKVVIGGGKAGVRIQVADSEKKINKFAVLQIADLKELSFMFKLTTGLIYMVEGSYYEKLYSAFCQSMDYKPSKEENHNTLDFSNTPKDLAPVEAVYKVKTNGKVITKAGFKGIPVIITDSNQETVLALSEEKAKTLNWFNLFEEKLNEGITKEFKVKAIPSGKNLKFVELAS